MPNTIAEYYTDELVDWKDSISFYNHEMEDFTKKLEEVISRNSITGIAAMVEAQQDRLNQVADRFYRLQINMEEQEKALKSGSSLIDNTLISQDTENRQNALRRNMQAIEKEYIDAKFECYTFLSGTLKK